MTCENEVPGQRYEDVMKSVLDDLKDCKKIGSLPTMRHVERSREEMDKANAYEISLSSFLVDLAALDDTQLEDGQALYEMLKKMQKAAAANAGWRVGDEDE